MLCIMQIFISVATNYTDMYKYTCYYTNTLTYTSTYTYAHPLFYYNLFVLVVQTISLGRCGDQIDQLLVVYFTRNWSEAMSIVCWDQLVFCF